MADFSSSLTTIRSNIKILKSKKNDDSAVDEALDSLRITFGNLGSDKSFRRYGVQSANTTKTNNEVHTWLTSKHDQFINFLLASVERNKRFALPIFFKTLKNCVDQTDSKAITSTPLLTLLARALTTHRENDRASVEESYLTQVGEWLLGHRDLRYFMLVELRAICEASPTSVTAIDNIFNLMVLLGFPDTDPETGEELGEPKYLVDVRDSVVLGDTEEESDDDNAPQQKKRKKSPAVTQLRTYRNIYTKAWLSFLNLPLNPRQHNAVLAFLPTNILPNIREPLLLSDYLTRSYEVGGVTSLNALNSLFVLMTKHNLEYPNFYKSLYGLINEQCFFSKWRGRFFRLLSLCLGSSHLPAYVVAAFCKKLTRCSLSAPVSGCLFTIAFVQNLLLKFPECNILVDRPGESGDFVDGFDELETDPSKCGAINSSLWELAALKKHFHPDVVKLAHVFDKSKRSETVLNDLEGYLENSYKSLFTKEIQKVKGGGGGKTTTTLAFKTPEALFTSGEGLVRLK